MFSNRFAALMLEKAKKERNAEIKQELLALSAISAKVPANPASTFHEAVQAVYFAHLINLIETNAYSMSFGRLDQYLYPYYIDDIKNNRITNEKAQEILNCFWIKINDLMHVDDSESVYFHGGHPFGEHITVGGMNTDGEDCVNDLSYMCLDAHAGQSSFSNPILACDFIKTPLMSLKDAEPRSSVWAWGYHKYSMTRSLLKH